MDDTDAGRILAIFSCILSRGLEKTARMLSDHVDENSSWQSQSSHPQLTEIINMAQTWLFCKWCYTLLIVQARNDDDIFTHSYNSAVSARSRESCTGTQICLTSTHPRCLSASSLIPTELVSIPPIPGVRPIPTYPYRVHPHPCISCRVPVITFSVIYPSLCSLLAYSTVVAYRSGLQGETWCGSLWQWYVC